MITHSWNGTVLTITSDSGTSSADLKGEMGVRGPQGPGYANYSYFGTLYANAAKVIDISATTADDVKLYLFTTATGYDAVVSGRGAIADYVYVEAEYTTSHTDNRPYDAEKIMRLHIEDGITSVGDYFMYKAFNLAELTFDNAGAITHLGAGAFAYTSIKGEYEFTNLENTKLDGVFKHCPKLEGLTFNNTITEITEKAFQMCISLRYVNGLANVTQIGDAAFQYCSVLENIDVVPGNVALGNWVFILTPIDAKAGETILSGASWKSQGALCFTPNEWTPEQLASIRAVKGESIQMPIPESDNQGTEFYKHWGLFPRVRGGTYKGYTLPASGCCGIFSLYHIHNILHSNSQYDTFYDWMMREIVPHKITVTESLYNTLNGCDYGKALIAGNTAVSYTVGSEISARDLPMSLDAETETWGEEGTSFWGCCQAMGWTATKMLFDGSTESGAKVKQTILDNLAVNKPVEMEIVGAGSFGEVSGHGMHAVVAIGYDAATDKLLIIDSTGGFDADVVPLSYWCSFESLITPHETSAIWTFDFGEVITLTSVDKKLDALLQSASFRMESGVLQVDGDETGTDGVYALKIPCANGAKLFFIQADNTEIVDTVNNRTTYNVIIKGTTENDGNGWFVGAFGQMLKKDIGTKTDRAHMYNMKVLSTNKWQPGETGTSCTNTDGISITTLGVKAGKYNWTAYYWDE